MNIKIRQKKNYKNNFFDSSFFKYTLKTTLRRFSIYVASIAYLLLIAIVINVVPILANFQPMWILENPIVPSFFVFGNSTLVALIVIEIFRTPIEDGTEIITMSKPLSRWEISIVKMSIFLLYVFIISIVASIFASFVYFNKNSSYRDSTIIVVGIFVGNIISSIIFGGIAIILSIYCKKVISLLIIISVSFSLTLINVFITLSSMNPIKVLKKQDINLKYTNLIDTVNTNDNSNTLKIEYGFIPVKNNGDVINNIKPSTIYNDAKIISDWDVLSYINLSNQLSQMYLLNSSSYFPQRLLQTSSSYSNSSKFIFEDYNIDEQKNYNIYFSFPKEIENLVTDKKNLLINQYLMELKTSYEFAFMTKPTHYLTKRINYNHLWNKKINSDLFNLVWNKYEKSIETELQLNYKKYFDNLNTSNEYDISSIPNPLSILISKVAIDYKVNSNSNSNSFFDFVIELLWSSVANFINIGDFDIFTVIDLFNVRKDIPNVITNSQVMKVRNVFPNYDDIDPTIKQKINDILQINVDSSTDFTLIQNAVNNNAYLKNFFLNKLKNRSKNIAILRSVGYTPTSEINPLSHDFIHQVNNTIGYYPKNISNYDENDIDYENNFINFNYSSFVNLQPESYFKMFQVIQTISLYDGRILFPVWIGIGLVLFVLGVALYSKRDYV